MQDRIDGSLHLERFADVRVQQREGGVVHEMLHVVLASRDEIVHAEDLRAFGQQAVAQVRAQETGAAGDDDPANPLWHGQACYVG